MTRGTEERPSENNGIRRLFLLRHGKAEKLFEGDDRQRPIKTRGKRDAQRVGAWMQRTGLHLDQVISSPALRTRTAAEKSVKAMGQSVQCIHDDPCLYDGQLVDLLNMIEGVQPKCRHLMLVGHKSGLEALLHYLFPVQESSIRMRKGALVCIDVMSDWSGFAPETVRWVEQITPDQLPEKFQYPAPNGDFWRDRPAYYYTQSAVIPYRMENGLLEILVMGSSSGRHWGVPKGIAEPGLSLQDSAAKEAFEEAGVLGAIDGVVGDYDYPKWGGRCSVAVYSLRVTEVLAEADWPEFHRGRRWLSPDAAVACVEQPELRRLLSRWLQTVKA
ncbi:phosphohistidine phosphatase [Oleiphilus messinensis]|uniref:Phosphohistidine phosphatase n=1 Tax=Oleiphilus messinensis TaxID=141451 RepID=A0A1Y0IF89_9GAMM|nr:NUDIX domain-containing protein [Oleiphilus messinensis]ARU58789.1 phosphohistidine phosphatase [Oleiphilus messinensis]